MAQPSAGTAVVREERGWILSAKPATHRLVVLSTQPRGHGAHLEHSVFTTQNATISSPPENRKAAVTARILSLVHELLGKGIHVTKRDLFYTDVKLFEVGAVPRGPCRAAPYYPCLQHWSCFGEGGKAPYRTSM